MKAIRDIISQSVSYLQRLLTRPTAELSRAQRALRYSYELAHHCISELGHDAALQMAAALTFRTIFSLIPLFVLALVVFRLTGGLDEKRDQIQQELYNYLGLNFSAPTDMPASILDPEGKQTFNGQQSLSQISRVQTADAALRSAQSLDVLDAIYDTETYSRAMDRGSQPILLYDPVAPGSSADDMAEGTDDQKRETRASLDKIIQDLTDKVSNTSASGITVVGLLVLIWAAVALVVTVEQSLNTIYGTPTGRPWHMKIMIYWGVITLGPVLLAVSLYVAGQIMAWAQTLGPVGWLAEQLSRFTALAASWLLLFLLYVLMPNTRVHLKPAAIGAFVAACLWETGKWGFKLYAANAGFSTIYGSLAMIPLFLYWVYITWAIVLFGAELSFTLQAMQGRKFKHDASRADKQVFVDPRWVLPVMVALGREFDEGKALTADELSQRLSLPYRAVDILARKLQDAGLIHRVECNDESVCTYTLSRSPDRLTVASLLETGDRFVEHFTQEHQHKHEWQMIQKLDQARVEKAGDMTLKDLMREETAA